MHNSYHPSTSPSTLSSSSLFPEPPASHLSLHRDPLSTALCSSSALISPPSTLQHSSSSPPSPQHSWSSLHLETFHHYQTFLNTRPEISSLTHITPCNCSHPHRILGTLRYPSQTLTPIRSKAHPNHIYSFSLGFPSSSKTPPRIYFPSENCPSKSFPPPYPFLHPVFSLIQFPVFSAFRLQPLPELSDLLQY